MARAIANRFVALKGFIKQHRRHLPTAALLTGFVFDFLTLGRPDRFFDNAVLLFYLIVAGVGILLINHAQERGREVRLPLLLLVQFSFGNLASALFILYGKSGTLAGNWPFFLMLAVLLIGNEFLRGRYRRLRFHFAIYYLVLFSYLALVVPVFVKNMGMLIFLASALVSLIAIAAFFILVRFTAPRRMRENKRALAALVAAIFLGFNVLYFANLIPPVPLSLREIGIYHEVVREGNVYRVSYEKGEWYEFWKQSDDVFRFRQGESAYCFSSVFSPEGLEVPIRHRWEYYDEKEDAWRETAEIAFVLSGGRDEGFRGFSVISALFPGEWRCNVETDRGVLIGRREFIVVATIGDVELETAVR